jgi:hypothetical protein
MRSVLGLQEEQPLGACQLKGGLGGSDNPPFPLLSVCPTLKTQCSISPCSQNQLLASLFLIVPEEAEGCHPCVPQCLPILSSHLSSAVFPGLSTVMEVLPCLVLDPES